MSAGRAKGTRWETAIVTWLNDHGFPHAERRALAGALDKGDITGIPGGPAIEAKNQNRHSLAEYLDEAKAEAVNAGAPFGVAWIKRRGKASAGDGYVVMDGHAFVALMRAAGYGHPTPTTDQETP